MREAIRIREHLGEGEVVVVTVGDERADTALRRCLAMGADRAIRVESLRPRAFRQPDLYEGLPVGDQVGAVGECLDLDRLGPLSKRQEGFAHHRG